MRFLLPLASSEQPLTRSFNSSSATIRPDDHKRARPLPRAGAGLGPADSIGRELDAIINGQAGVLQSENGVGDNHVLENYVSVTLFVSHHNIRETAPRDSHHGTRMCGPKEHTAPLHMARVVCAAH
jgi:hypothetical protein